MVKGLGLRVEGCIRMSQDQQCGCFAFVRFGVRVYEHVGFRCCFFCLGLAYILTPSVTTTPPTPPHG